MRAAFLFVVFPSISALIYASHYCGVLVTVLAFFLLEGCPGINQEFNYNGYKR